MSKTIKRLQKAKARRKDYEKKRNIIKNAPRIHKTYKKPVYKQEADRKGVVKVVQIGEKEVRYSISIKPRVQFPKSRKNKDAKKKNVKKAK